MYILQMRKLVAKIQEKALEEKITVQNAIQKVVYAKNVKKGILLIKMVDALIQIIVKYLKKENALNAKKILYWLAK